MCLQVLPCRIAIFLNIWSSIFSAAFFAYVRPSGNMDTELILYFVRLFSDLVGRPLARLPRPSWISNKDQLVRLAALRLVLLVVFFCYIGFDWMPQSDAFIITVVALFSIMSGYLAVLSYEYAAGALQTKAGQSMAGTLMNSTFQVTLPPPPSPNTLTYTFLCQDCRIHRGSDGSDRVAAGAVQGPFFRGGELDRRLLRIWRQPPPRCQL